MDLTTSGRFRVLGRPRGDDELLIVDVESFDPTYVREDAVVGDAAPSLGERVADLRAGYLVDATLAWRDGTPRVSALSVVGRTRIEFVDGVTGLFEAARETWHGAAGEAMNSRVTYDTDGAPNGALYVFAKQTGARDLFDEFRNGVTPLEPLLERVNERRDDDDPREVFVMRPADEPFLVVYIVFRKGGLLAETLRETYDCPRDPSGAEG